MHQAITYATEYEPVSSEHTDKPIFTEHATKDAAVRAARKISGKEAPFGPIVYVLAMRGAERVGQLVYANGRRDSADGEGF